jgi:PAS domain S-box-containing protein
MQVLLAIADPRGREFLEGVLRSRGHQVTSCSSADEALDARRRAGHRLVLVGSRLFAGGGYASLQRMRLGPTERSMFLMAVAEDGGAPECEGLIEAGANDVLVRQFDEPLANSRIAVAEELIRQSDAAEEARRALEARMRQSEALADLGRRALEGLDVPALFDAAARAVARTLDVEFVKIAEATADGAELVLRGGVGWKPGLLGRARMSAAQGSQAGFALRSGEPVVVDDLRKETRFRGATLLKDHGIVSGVSVVIRGPERAYGVLGAHTTKLRAFAPEDVLFLAGVANVMGAAVVHAATDDRLRANEERARAVLDSALDAVIAMDASEAVIAWNERAEEMFGWARVDALGKRMSDLIVPPRERDAHRRGLTRFLTTGEGPMLNRRVELIALRRDGTEFPVEVTVTPIRSADGFAFYAFLRDISERRRAEQALRESERFNRHLVEATPCVAFVVDVAGRRVEYVSERAESVIGWKPAELTALGTSLLERLVHPEDRPKIAALLARWEAAAGGSSRDEILQEEFRARDRSGAYRHLRASTAVFARTPEGRVRQVVGTCEDVTRARREEEERAALEARVRAAQKAESLGILAGGIAHDFNNLLTSVLGNVGLAQIHMRDESPARPYVAQIETAARRAADLTNQMLAYAGKGRLVLERVDLSRLVEEMAALLKTVVSKDVRIVFRPGVDVPAVEADATQLRQVVMNLITNASEACIGRAGEVVITTAALAVGPGEVRGIGSREALPAGTYVAFEVSDSGVGMSADTLARIFDPFFTTKKAGRGLGLAAVLGIVRGHGGAIRVHSEPDHGSTFQVLLPSVPARGPGAPPGESAERGWHGSGTVLLVDDEADVRRAASAMLASLGFDVLEAADGLEAQRLFRAQASRVVLVVLDLTMPRLDGARALARLRAIRPDVKVVVSSGNADDDVAARFSKQDPPAGYLHKPYTIEDMRRTLKAVLA